MHTLESCLQSQGYAAGTRAADRLLSLASAHSYSSLDVAVAYASSLGVSGFVDRILGAMPNREAVNKRWLLSVDFGQTSPDALEQLLGLSASEVRVPDGHLLLDNYLRPRQCFHPKCYVFRQDASPPSELPASCLVGSSNLTVGGLYGNTEHGISARLWGKVRRNDAQAAALFADIDKWWRATWPLADIVDAAFINRYRRIQRRRIVIQDADAISRMPYFEVPAELDATETASWATSNCLWIQTRGLYKNNGPLSPGNQLDCRRGTRVFFGFSPASVARNTVLGEVEIRFGTKQATMRSVRFGNNSMDKVNLPMPGGLTGPQSYDNQYLLFMKTARGCFSLSFTTPQQLSRLRARSVKLGLYYTFGQGAQAREFGFG